MNKTLVRHPIAQLTLAFALAAAAASGAQAQTAARDGASSPLRAPTAAEAQSLHPAARAAAPVGMITGTVNPQPVRYKDGTIGQELDASTMMYSVARRNVDGSVSEYCVEGPEAAQKVVDGKVATEIKGNQHELK